MSPAASPTLTGNWREDGVYGTGQCATGGTGMCAGDSNQPGSPRYDAFLTFELSGVPASIVELTEARLQLPVNQVYGDPFADLGVLNVEHVAFSEIGPESVSAEVLAIAGSIAAVGLGEAATTLTTEMLRASLQASNSSVQYRLRFSSATDADDATDLVIFNRAGSRLGLTYLLP
jgi:hypothetical protein